MFAVAGLDVIDLLDLILERCLLLVLTTHYILVYNKSKNVHNHALNLGFV